LSDFLFIEEIPDNLKTDYSRSIFHEQAHLKLQSLSGWISFGLFNSKEQILLAEVHVHSKNGVALSPFRSPFGSFLFSEKLQPAYLTKFIGDVKEALMRKGVSKIYFRNSPDSYFPLKHKLIEHALNESGFVKAGSENTACILVDQVEFVKKLQETQRWRLNKAHKQKFCFDLLPISSWGSVYDFIKKCRDKKSYSLSMNAEEVSALVMKFPDKILLPVVMADTKIIAAALCIKVYDHVLYTFYYDHDFSYNAYSPVIMLMEGLYTYCRTCSISLIDLGTAMVEGEEKESLMDFKLSLGARLFQKNSYEIIL
jgi:hypothetical protein